MEKHPLIYFFLFAYLTSWILWTPLMYGHFKLGWTNWEGNTWTNYKAILGLLGALGPAISAIIMTAVIDGKNGVRSLLKRAVKWRVNIVWWLVALYFWWLVCSILAATYGFTSIKNIATGFAISLINLPGLILIIQLPTLLIGMFGEELGWRGFALPRLLNKYNPIISSLLLALLWMFWHAPLAVFQEWRGNLPIDQFLLHYMLLIVPMTLIITYFFKKVKGSVLLAMVFHASINLTFNAYSVALRLDESYTAILKEKLIIALWIIAGIIILHYLYKTYISQPKNKIQNAELLST